jgi:type II secretory pathway pseudopilin PulG
LVELAVTVTLLALLLIMSVPFTRGWINSAKVSDAESVLQHAIGLARSHAKHSLEVEGVSQAPVAVVCIIDSDLEVRLVNRDIDLSMGQKPCIHSKVVWRTQITDQVTQSFINDDNEPVMLSEMYFDRDGQLASQYCHSAVKQGNCATSDTLEVSAEGAEKVQFSAR